MKTNYFFESGGYEFESGMADVVEAFATREWGSRAVKASTQSQDSYEGTDLFVLGVPIDITIDFDRKDKTRRLGGLSLDGVAIDFGIRYGNRKANFNLPVLVIGAASAVGITRSNMRLVLDIIKENIKKILNMGMDEYLLATGV